MDPISGADQRLKQAEDAYVAAFTEAGPRPELAEERQTLFNLSATARGVHREALNSRFEYHQSISESREKVASLTAEVEKVKSALDTLSTTLDDTIQSATSTLSDKVDSTIQSATTELTTKIETTVTSAINRLTVNINDGVKKLMLDRAGLRKMVPDSSSNTSTLDRITLPNFWSLTPTTQTVSVWGDRAVIHALDKAVGMNFARISATYNDANSDLEAIALSLNLVLIKHNRPKREISSLEAMLRSENLDEVIENFCKVQRFSPQSVDVVKREASSRYDEQKPLTIWHVILLVDMVVRDIQKHVSADKADIGLGLCYKSSEVGGIRVYYWSPIASSIESATDVVWLCNENATVDGEEDIAYPYMWKTGRWSALGVRGPTSFGRPDSSLSVAAENAPAVRIFAAGLQHGRYSDRFRDQSEDDVENMLQEAWRSGSAMSFYHKPAGKTPEYMSMDAAAASDPQEPSTAAKIGEGFRLAARQRSDNQPAAPIMGVMGPPMFSSNQPSALRQTNSTPNMAVTASKSLSIKARWNKFWSSKESLVAGDNLQATASGSSPQFGNLAISGGAPMHTGVQSSGRHHHSLPRSLSSIEKKTDEEKRWDEIHSGHRPIDIGPPGTDPRTYDGGRYLTEDGIAMLMRGGASQAADRKNNFTNKNGYKCIATQLKHGRDSPEWKDTNGPCGGCIKAKTLCMAMADESRHIYIKGHGDPKVKLPLPLPMEGEEEGEEEGEVL